MKKSRVGQSGGASAAGPEQDPRAVLVDALQGVGLDGEAAALFGDAVVVLGALSQGRRVRDLTLASESPSARAAQEVGTRPRADGAPGSMEDHLRQGDVALGAVEALAACAARLEAAMVVVTAEQVTAVGGALLAQRDVADPGELSKTARERWRARAKSRVRAELAPAIGWTPGECAHLVALACAPIAFSTPVVAQMALGVLSWRLARSLWRACEGLDAADAAHIAAVMCGDDPGSCVPERLAADGSIQEGPWQHRAFYAALTREVAKVTGADDADPEAARLDRARREAAYAGRRVLASVDEDGTGSITLITSALWVAAIKDRLNRAARVARGAGDARTLDQLESDIARTLLAHASLGFADQPEPGENADGTDPTPEDLVRAGWSPELVAALSGLPPAVLQVIVPLMGLHDPATAEPLPTVGRATNRPDPNSVPDPNNVPDPNTSGPESEEEVHTGRAGCPACLPSVRTRRTAEELVPKVPGEGCARRQDQGWPLPQGTSGASASSEQVAGGVRRLWVGEVLGSFSMFVSPVGVRALALAPGTTLSRLLVDPADGRCVERSIGTYRPDAAMRAQILAADVTCRAPACDHTGSSCQVDHVIEYGTPGGVTKESNGQLAHTGHHEAKTAKDWDADLSANRDVQWTTLLARIYRTRAFDYRRYVTFVVDAIDAVRSAPAGAGVFELDRQIYLALTHRDLGERLNVGDDDLDPDITRFEGWPVVRLTHRDPHTGQRVPGPSADATAEVHAARATSGPPVEPATDGATCAAGASETDTETTGAATKTPAPAPEASTPAPEASAAGVDAASTCNEPCCRHLRRVAARAWATSPPITHLDGRTGKPLTHEEYRELRKAWTLANHEGILPF